METVHHAVELTNRSHDVCVFALPSRKAGNFYSRRTKKRGEQE